MKTEGRFYKAKMFCDDRKDSLTTLFLNKGTYVITVIYFALYYAKLRNRRGPNIKHEGTTNCSVLSGPIWCSFAPKEFSRVSMSSFALLAITHLSAERCTERLV